MNVLLTCAGRRNYMVQYFREALEGRGRVFAADAAPEAPALQEADGAFVLPLVHDPEYLDRLLALCCENEVRLVVSLNDLELPVLAAARERFRAIGAFPLVSSSEVIETCFDKWRTAAFLTDHGLPAPTAFTRLEDARAGLSRGEMSYPVVVKPRWGTASIGIEFPADGDELELSYALLRRRLSRTSLARASEREPEHAILIQERLRGEEYGLNVVNDLQGRYAGCFAIRKLAMHAGETDRAVTVRLPELDRLAESVSRALGHVGNLDCDVFRDGDGTCRILEMNPRFGGHYPFAHIAGANLPAALVAWAEGRPVDEDWFRMREGVMAAKCPRLVLRRT